MRLFAALDLDSGIRQRIARFLEGVREWAPQARWASPESLHVTLKFIGESEKLEALRAALAGVQADAVTLSFQGTGFFPAPRSARVFWIGIESDERLAALASKIDEALAPLGIAAEKRAYTPHLTLARGGAGALQRLRQDGRNSNFSQLQQRLAKVPAPEFGTMTAREFFLFQSKLSPKGAVYTKLAEFPLH